MDPASLGEVVYGGGNLVGRSRVDVGLDDNPQKDQRQITGDQWCPQVTKSWECGGENLHSSTLGVAVDPGFEPCRAADRATPCHPGTGPLATGPHKGWTRATPCCQRRAYCSPPVPITDVLDVTNVSKTLENCKEVTFTLVRLVRDTGIEPDDALRITVEPYLEVRIVCTARDQRVQAVSRCGASGLGTRGSDVALRSGH